MSKNILYAILIIASVSIFDISCKKEVEQKPAKAEIESGIVNENAAVQRSAPDPYNLDVDLTGQENEKGNIKFRQDPDPAKIITLDTKIQHLQSNHEYLLQRAVDQTIDGDCTGTAWLTLGLGLVPQSISTNGGGNGTEELWRDVSAVASGAVFDIHFRIVDAANMSVVLTSGCYQYTVR
jgi:hypothetical protein